MGNRIAQWLDDRVPGVDPCNLEKYKISHRSALKCGGLRQGRDGWVLPVFVDPPSPWRIVDDPVLLDFVIFDPAQPSRWKTIYGYGVMLGEEAFAEARVFDLPLPVFRHPLSWLQEAGAGVCILDPAAFGRSMIGTSVRLIAEDLQHGEQIDRAIRAAVDFAYPTIQVAA